jgi:hypothetical protein
VTLSDEGLWMVEVLDDVSLLGAALVAIGSGWAAVLASGGRAASPPTFTAGAGSVTVALSGASTQTVWSRRVCIEGPAFNALT